MTAGEYRRYWKAGFQPVNDNMVIVFSRLRFGNHISKNPIGTLHAWVSRSCDPPIIYFNDTIWVYSPGPPPRVLVELD